MIKLGSAMLTALALGVLASQPASAGVFCETEVPRSSTTDSGTPGTGGPTNSNGKKNFQNLSMCFDSTRAATASVIKSGHTSTRSEYFLSVNLSRGKNADLIIVDAVVGNPVPDTDCFVNDATADGSEVTNSNCAVTGSTLLGKQLFMYLHINN